MNSMRLYIPSNLAADLLADGDAEEAIRVRGVTEIAHLAVETINATTALVAIAGGAVATRRFAESVVRRLASRREGKATRLTLTYANESKSIELSEDDTEAAKQIEELLRSIRQN